MKDGQIYVPERSEEEYKNRRQEIDATIKNLFTNDLASSASDIDEDDDLPF